MSQYFLRRNRRMAVGEYISLIDPTVVDWCYSVVANGGITPSTNTQNVLTTFMNGMNAAGLASKMTTINCFVPDNLTAAITPLIKGVGISPWTNVGFVAGDLSVNGIKGDGASKYLDTGVLPSNIAGQPNACGLTVYYYTNVNEPTIEIHSSDGSNQLGLYLYYDSIYFDCYNIAGGRITTGVSTFTGYVSGNRIASNREDIYTANSTTPHSSIVNGTGAPGTVVTTRTCYAFAANVNGTPTLFSSKRLSFIAIHNGLTSSESLAFYNLIQTLRQNLGGGYV